MNPRSRIERDLRQWLRLHHGIIGYAEALHIGASPHTVETKAARGEWERLYRGVYRDAASPPGPYQDLRAACVATAGFGVVSHRSAAWVWGLLRQPPAVPELTLRAGTRDARRNGFTTHRSRDLDVAAAVQRNGILVTNPLRTLVDLAGCVVPAQLTEAVDNALARRLVTTAGLEAEIERLSRPGRNGVGALRRHLLDRGYIGAPQASVLEAYMGRLIRTTGVDEPTRELHVGDHGEYRLDFAWGEILFAIEVDGYAWHFTPEHKERDETRRNDLRLAGWTVLVYGWRQVLTEPGRVAAEIRATYRRLSRPG